LQMALAYAALANEGELMEPRLVKEVISPEGDLLERPQPRVVRQVVSAEVARAVGRAMVEVVEDGTGTAARLGSFEVAGKTGTARAYSPDGGYSGGYIASFGAIFPADDPQLVIFVKLDGPQGAYYGGTTAAPVTRATMEAALALQEAPLDRSALYAAVRPAPATRAAPPGTPVRFAANVPSLPSLPDDVPEVRAPIPADGRVLIPDVGGLSPRVAARRLHAAGLRVQWDGGSRVISTRPTAGSRTLAGDTIRLVTQPASRP